MCLAFVLRCILWYFYLQITEKTRAALEKSVSQKIAAAMPVRAADKLAPAQYIRYVVLVRVQDIATCKID